LDQNGGASWDASTQGITIGVAAPADPLIGALPNDSYTHWSGTSGAAPLISGLAALIRADDPSMSAHQVINQILETAQDSGDAGQDHLYGRGIVDAAAAVTADVPPVSANPMGSIADWITLHRRGELQETQPEDEGREVAGSIEYPTEVPQAAQREKQPEVLQPLVVITATILLLAAIATALILLRKQAKNRQSS
jgi:subtilisin family serine protease